MKTHTKTNPFVNRIGIAGLACLYSAMTNIAVAGPLDIANNALEIATGVEPNVMILNDDSGSMDWSVLIPNTSEGLYIINGPVSGFSYAYIQPDPENGDFFAVPTEIELQQFAAFWDSRGYNGDEWRGVWRSRNHNFNSVYYNPDTTYTPWEGADNNGDAYTDASPTAALVDPYVSGGSTYNLTANDTFTSLMIIENGDCCYGLSDVIYPASYYTWTDSNGDGFVDPTEPHQLIEIRTSGAPTDPAGALFDPATHTRAGTRTDCGGDGEATSTTTCTIAQELQNYANFYSYYRRRELTAKAAISKVLEPQSSVRVGFAAINNVSNNRIEVESLNISPFSGNKKDLFDSIFETQSTGGTPLRQNLERTGEYFACNGGTHGDGSDVNIFGTASSNPGGSNCPVEAAPAGTCQQNYTILMTDGFWNGNDPDVDNADNDGLNDGTPQGPFDGASFGDAFSNTLADVAMHYYERDLHDPTLVDDVPTTNREEERYNGMADPFEKMHQHMITYTVGLGVSGTLSVNPPNSSDTFAWPEPSSNSTETIDDLRHAAWNGRGDFLNANNQEELTTSLTRIFEEIGTGRGSASSVAFNTQNLESGALVFRAFFDTDENTGNLIAQNVSITGEIDTSSNRWEAAEQLEGIIDGDRRQVITFDPVANSGVPFTWAGINSTQQGELDQPVLATPDLGETRLEYIRGSQENEGDDYSGGEFRVRPPLTVDDNTFIGGRIGDFIHSSPVFVGTPPFSFRDNLPFPDVLGELYSEFVTEYANRNEIVYIGANDGMLHAFDANTGEEVFAYVPDIIIPDLSELTNPDYQHRYYVDLSPAVNDVYIRTLSGTNALNDAWNTVLVGGMGVGAPGYFALNVTDPDSLRSEDTAKANVMWEFEQADDVGSSPDGNDLNLGVPISSPLIALSNILDASGDNRWVVIFGNGYNSASTDGDAELYIVFLDGGLDGTWTRGTDFFKINTGNGKAQDPTSTNTPNSLGGIRGIDIDQNGTVDVVYAGDYQGNFYRFNLSETSVSATLSAANNPVQELFKATYDSASGEVQPITNRPVVIKHPSEAGFIVIMGTGSFFTNDDITAPESEKIQSIYGLWDDFTDPSDNIDEVSYDQLVEQVFTNSASTVNGFTVRSLTNNSVTWGHQKNKDEGWVINLDVPEAGGSAIEFPGEKAVRNFLIRGNFAFVNTVIPKSSTACTTGPGGFELGFDPETGGSGDAQIFDVNNDGNFDSDDNIGGAEGEENIVTGVRFDQSTPTDSSFIGNRKVTQTSDRDIRSTGTNTGADSQIGRHSWREIIP